RTPARARDPSAVRSRARRRRGRS
ncbi:MAG: SSU ribosomal protein S13p (S18e), partial [uncultured Solirubrobacteraceae bacterium]